MLSENNLVTVLGVGGIERLVAAFYRQIPGDDLLGPMYPAEDLAGAEERLGLFLVFRFGGPQDYMQRRGHPALRMRHAPFAVTQAAGDRWMQLMENAIVECEFSEEVQGVLRGFLGNVATFLINRQ
ncbi:hemin receptor [Planctomyces bekefii]|uniref:Hemin receptor n=1 Tax=Planctomyces bekefii TaxID=1653850 RepID=A0A5C6MD92_9PLAN|nr:hemin receptor [Planctomyces bekefii]